MRLKTLRWLAIALASGALLQTAHGIDTFTAYNLGITFTNDSAGYWTVSGAPTTTGTSFLQISPMGRSSVQTDDSGRITGMGSLQVVYNQGGLPYSVFTVTYSGQISALTTSAPPTVTIAIRGPGYTVDGTGGPTTTLNFMSLQFAGQPGVNPLNANQIRIVGQLTGSIRGQTPLSPLIATLPSLQAVITGSSSNVVNFNTTIAQGATWMRAFNPSFLGSGVIGTSNGYILHTVGFGEDQGAYLLFSGLMGAYTNQNQNSGNLIGFTAPLSARFRGKIKGQAVSGSADASLITATLVQ